MIAEFALASLLAMRPAHRFYDKTSRIQLGAAITLAAWDSAMTCRNLSFPKGREHELPTQSCAGVNLILFGQVAAQEFLAYEFHRHNHHKLERVTRFFSMEENARGGIYSTINRNAFDKPKGRP